MLITHNYSAKCLLAFLNCKASEWLLGNITGNLGGNAKIGQKSNFLKLSVAQLSENDQRWFDLIIDEVLSKKKIGEDTTDDEREIDNAIYSIYGLNEIEVNKIESI